MIRTADVVVIGGGCMGASTACFLARLGVKVALVEKNYFASGPTGQSSAVIRQHYSIEQLVATSLRSLKVFQNFDEVVGGCPEFVKTGWLLLGDDGYAPTLRSLVEMQKKLGVNVKLLSLTDLNRLQPQTNVEDVMCVSYHPDTGYANPVVTTKLFSERAQRDGAYLYENTMVTGIRAKGGRVHAVITSKGEIDTPVVVNAAGPWGRKIGKMVDVDLPISPTRHQITVFQKPYDYWQPAMIYADLLQDSYLRPEGTDKFLVGASNEIFNHDKANPDDYSGEADPKTLPWSMGRIRHRFPVMKRASYRGGYAAVYDSTPDEQPIIGQMTEIDGFYCLVGWSGHGFKHSPAMGQLMAEMIITGTASDVDLSIFSPSRFREGFILNAKEF